MIEFLKKNKIKYTVSAEGMVYVNDNLFIKENENITFDKLAEVSGYVYVRENATFTAPALAEVSGSVEVRENATFTAPALAKSGSVYVRDNATFTAPALAKSGSVEVRENATFTAPALAKYGYVDVSEGAIFTAPALMAHKWLARTLITITKKGTKMNERTPTPWAVNGLAIMSSPDIAKQRPLGMAVHEPDLEFIVRACNAHDALVEALEEAVRHLAAPEGSTHEEPWPESPLGRARAALKLARGEV